MTGVGVLIAVSVLGIKWGWQPVAGGGIEYIIQIEPQTLESLKNGQDLQSDLPPLNEIRSYRITVGSERLPHEGEPPPAPRPASTAPAIETSAKAPPAVKASPPTAKAADGPDLAQPQKISTELPAAAHPMPWVTEGAPAGRDPWVKQAGGSLPPSSSAAGAAPAAAAASQTPAPPHVESEGEVKKPWWALTATLLGLFTSFGLNLYLGLIAWDLRARYRNVVARLKQDASSS
jgi:hypothetical protein